MPAAVGSNRADEPLVPTLGGLPTGEGVLAEDRGEVGDFLLAQLSALGLPEHRSGDPRAQWRVHPGELVVHTGCDLPAAHLHLGDGHPHQPVAFDPRRTAVPFTIGRCIQPVEVSERSFGAATSVSAAAGRTASAPASPRTVRRSRHRIPTISYLPYQELSIDTGGGALWIPLRSWNHPTARCHPNHSSGAAIPHHPAGVLAILCRPRVLIRFGRYDTGMTLVVINATR